MKLLTILVVLALIFGLIFYTADTLGVIKIVGKHSVTFAINVYKDMKEKSDKGEFDDVFSDLKKD